jgi:tRNA (guanine37-N1)-methyltransferase
VVVVWNVNVLTTLPAFYVNLFNVALYGKGIKNNSWRYKVADIRDYTNNKHMSIDDAPYGGGAGMILKTDVLGWAIDDFFANGQKIYYLSPRGKHITQKRIEKIVRTHKTLNLLCGRFEGIDERVLTKFNITEISIGDFVITSGDIAALVLIDCCLRFVPQFLGNKDTHKEESFGQGIYQNLLEYPHYTKPAVWRELSVPSVLLSGHHEKIYRWRLDMAKKITRIRRYDLWSKHIKQQINE